MERRRGGGFEKRRPLAIFEIALGISKIEVTRLTTRQQEQLSECVNDSFYTYLERSLLDYWTISRDIDRPTPGYLLCLSQTKTCN
jgi:hypothetical protein